MRKSSPIRRATAAHTDLNVFAIVRAVLESGCIYGGPKSQAAAKKIIEICDRQTARLVHEHDAAIYDSGELP